MGRKKRKAKPVVEKPPTVQGSAWLRAADVPYTAEQGVSFFVDDERSGIVSREFLDKLLYGVQPSANRAPLMGNGKPLVRAPRAVDVARENKEFMRDLYAANRYRTQGIDSVMGGREEGHLRGYIPRDDPGMEELEQRKGLEIFDSLSNRNSPGIWNPLQELHDRTVKRTLRRLMDTTPAPTLFQANSRVERPPIDSFHPKERIFEMVRRQKEELEELKKPLGLEEIFLEADVIKAENHAPLSIHVMGQHQLPIDRLPVEIDENGELTKPVSVVWTLPDIAAPPAQDDEDRFCVVCLERERTHATIPCGHKHYCEACVAKLVECATCRKTITFNIRIFD